MLARNEAYHRARLASEKILDDAYRATDQLSAEAITDADAKLHSALFSAQAKAVRDATYAAAGDARAEMAEAERRHYDRLAATQRHSDSRWRAAAIPTPTTLSLSSRL